MTRRAGAAALTGLVVFAAACGVRAQDEPVDPAHPTAGADRDSQRYRAAFAVGQQPVAVAVHPVGVREHRLRLTARTL